jgi:hypothetical protein
MQNAPPNRQARFIALSDGTPILVDGNLPEHVYERSWHYSRKHGTVFRVHGGGRARHSRQFLHEHVLGVAGYVALYHRNGDLLDYRRENLIALNHKGRRTLRRLLEREQGQHEATANP